VHRLGIYTRLGCGLVHRLGIYTRLGCGLVHRLGIYTRLGCGLVHRPFFKNYPSRAPVFSSDYGLGHFPLYGRSEEWYTLLAVGYYASWHLKKTIIPDYQSATVISGNIRPFLGAKSLTA